MKVAARQITVSRPRSHNLICSFTFWLSLSLLMFVPLAFSTFVYRTFSLPKFLILLTGCLALAPLIAYKLLVDARWGYRSGSVPGSKHISLIVAYFIAQAVSAILGAAPIGSFFGSFENQMGLLTRLCFLVCFLGLIVSIGRSRMRLVQLLWAILLTGLAVATYAFVQFFGKDPFLPSSVYTSASTGNSIFRAVGTLGHADYLGNFLLYITPLAAGLALASSGRARRVAVAASVISALSIVFSGTRGAWIGLIAGVVTFTAIEFPKNAGKAITARWQPMVARLLIAVAVLVVSVWLIRSSAVSRDIVARARSFVSEGYSGAGRTLLWRDSLRMVIDSPIVGCGPEAFRKAFLAYKSRELARFSPDINNESSHSSYIDAAVSFGLPGAILYVAIITSTCTLYWKARQRAADRRLRLIITGLLCSFVAVVTHNFFIFDQISTGLYFYSFVALAYVAYRLADDQDVKSSLRLRKDRPEPDSEKGSARTGKSKRAAVALAASGVMLLSAASFSLVEITSDRQIGKALGAAAEGNLDQVVKSVYSATQTVDPVGGYEFLAARALTHCAERIESRGQVSGAKDTSAARRIAIDLALAHAQKSLSHTLTPDSGYLLLAYLAFLNGDAANLRQYASEAVKWDSHFANARWLTAEAYLAEGDRERALDEAKVALELNPSLPQARSVLERAQGEVETRRLKVERALANARTMVSRGNLRQAESVVRRAISRSIGPCPDCHSLLASIYEANHRPERAIEEWKVFIALAPDRASAEAASQRISALQMRVTKK